MSAQSIATKGYLGDPFCIATRGYLCDDVAKKTGQASPTGPRTVPVPEGYELQITDTGFTFEPIDGYWADEPAETTSLVRQRARRRWRPTVEVPEDLWDDELYTLLLVMLNE